MRKNPVRFSKKSEQAGLKKGRFLALNRHQLIQILVTVALITLVTVTYLLSSLALLIFSLAALFIWLAYSIKHTANWVVLVILVLLLFISQKEMSKNVIIISSFSVPEQFVKANPGYSGDVLAAHLLDQVHLIGAEIIRFEQTNSFIPNNREKERYDYSINAGTVMPEFYFQQIGISLNVFYQYLKKQGYFQQLFGYRYVQLDGDIISIAGGGNRLTIRVSAAGRIFSRMIDWKGENSLKDAAQFLLRHTDMKKLARYYQILGDYDNVIRHCRETAMDGGDSAELQNILGVALAFKGRQNEAAMAFQRAIHLDPFYGRAYFNMGSYYLSQNRLNEALYNLKKAVRFAPDDISARYNLALVNLALGDTGTALKEFRTITRKRSNFTAAYYQMARIYLMMNNQKKARQVMEELGKSWQGDPSQWQKLLNDMGL